jgi:superfamily II DNA helicase RecQ
MRCKIFSVPIESESALDREKKLNEFVSAANVKRVFASVANAPEGPMWSVMFFYEEGPQSVQTMRPAPATQTVPLPARQAEPNNAGVPLDSETPLTREQVKWIIALKRWRADQAAQENVPLYMVAQNKWLEEIVRLPVRGMDDLMHVRGLGEWRIQKYGEKILEILGAAGTAKCTWPSNSSAYGRA